MVPVELVAAERLTGWQRITSSHNLKLTTARQRQGPRGERAVFCSGYRSVSVAGVVVIDNRRALRAGRRDGCYVFSP